MITTPGYRIVRLLTWVAVSSPPEHAQGVVMRPLLIQSRTHCDAIKAPC